MKKAPQGENRARKPSFSAVARAVARVTFFDIVRDKLLYNIFVFSVLLLGVGLLASRLSYARPERIVLDFGLAAVAISCSVIAGLTGAGLLGKEIERRTIYVALSRPITRPAFVAGKYLGLAGVVAADWALLSAALTLIVALSGSGFGGLGPSHATTVCWALAFTLVEALVVGAISIFFSTFTTATLAAMFTLGVYLAGNNVSQFRYVADRLKSPFEAAVLRTTAALLPDLEHFHLGLRVTYGLPLGWRVVLIALSYGAVLVTLLLTLSGLFVRGKEV